MSAAPLAGRGIVVTRPQAQAAALVAALRALGAHPLCLPLLDIAPVADPAPLEASIAGLPGCVLAIFVSPNAVIHAVPRILAQGGWPEGVVPAAVGPGTVRALESLGVSGCVVPAERFDSEALLDCPDLSSERVAGRRIMLFRGNGGRELLADSLRQRGAEVVPVTCYLRHAPSGDFSAWLAAWRSGRIDAVTVSSSEALGYLLAGLPAEGREALRRTPVFAPHARIADKARSAGLEHVVLTESGDHGLIDGLVAYNWPA